MIVIGIGIGIRLWRLDSVGPRLVRAIHGVRELFNGFDNRMVLVEQNPDGTVLRSRSFGAATEAALVQQEFFSNGQALYRADGSLLLGGESKVLAGETSDGCLDRGGIALGAEDGDAIVG